MAAAVCVVCKAELAVGDSPGSWGAKPPMVVRYEGRHYEFDRDRCKLIFQENPDRWLDAFGEVLDQPR